MALGLIQPSPRPDAETAGALLDALAPHPQSSFSILGRWHGAFPASKEVENEDYWGGYLCRAKHLRNGEGFRVR